MGVGVAMAQQHCSWQPCGSWRCDFTVMLMSAAVMLLAVGRRCSSTVGVSADLGSCLGMWTSSAEMVVVRNIPWIKWIVDRGHAAACTRRSGQTLLR